MDFLDKPVFASPEKAEYASILGIGNNKKKAAASAAGNADLQNRFPFSDDCAEQKRIISGLLAESAQLLATRNSAKGKTRTDLTGRLRAYDSYIPAAQEYMDNTSCAAVKLTTAADTQTLNAINAATAAAASESAVPSSSKIFLFAGIGIVLLVVSVVVIRKLKK